MTVKTEDAARGARSEAQTSPQGVGGRDRGTAEPGGPGGAGEGRQGAGPAGVARGVHTGSVAGSGVLRRTAGLARESKAWSSMPCMVAFYSVCLGPGKLGGQHSIRSLRGREVQKWQSWWWVKLLA